MADESTGAAEISNGFLAIPAEACAPMPRWLSSSEFKRRLYGTDTHSIEGLELVQEVFGEGARSFCHMHSLLVVKPEALVARQLKTILTWLEEVGFRVVDAVPFQFSPAITRGLWGYHWNAVTGAHRRAIDLLVESGMSIAILVTATEDSMVPASLRLADKKGHADPTRRRPGQLRFELGNFNPLLNHVHSPDEPIDVLRELAVVLAPAQYSLVVEAAKRGQRRDIRHLESELAASLYPAAGPRQPLDLIEVLAVIEDSIGPVDIHRLDLDDLLRRCGEACLTLSKWQRIVLTTASTASMRPDIKRLVPSTSVSDWLDFEV